MPTVAQRVSLSGDYPAVGQCQDIMSWGSSMNKNSLKKELWTQQEVAGYFRVVPSTVKNWRDRGLINYWQAPGSSRVLYFADEIKDFRNKNTFNKKGGVNKKHKTIVTREKPVVSTNPKKEWRI